MSRRIRGAATLAGLAVLGAALAGGGTARAGPIPVVSKGIIVVSGMTLQTGDPRYEYIFDVHLSAGLTLQPGGFFTMFDLPALPPGALNRAPNIDWGFSEQTLGLVPPGNYTLPFTDDPKIENATWEWHGIPMMAPATQDLDLGTFIVGSTTEVPSPPMPLLNWLGTVDGGVPVTLGKVQVTSIPEPSAVILLAMGVGAIPLLWLRRRRGRSRSVAG
jgi:hypothetical protein